jgi:hypothetical protein
MNIMKYGKLVGNQSMNSCIYRCFEYIDDADVKTFVKKFRNLQHHEEQIMHTFRELVLGAFLGSNQLKAKYDYNVYGQTPDWCLFDDELRLKCIVELVNFHIDKRTQDRIDSQIRDKGIATYFISNGERLYHKIWDKAGTYKTLAQDHNLAYVVAVFGTFQADVEVNEIRNCLFEEEKGLFGLYPAMSGLLFFTTFSGEHHFVYIQNPDALKKVDIAQGVFR